jgi:hypothetical protein
MNNKKQKKVLTYEVWLPQYVDCSHHTGHNTQYPVPVNITHTVYVYYCVRV